MRAGITLSRLDQVAVLAFDHPSGIPRLSVAVVQSLARHLEALATLKSCVGVVITGSEKAFCAGADIEEVAKLTAKEARAFTDCGQATMDRIERFPKPVVAAIQGHCIGGGFDLALACHARVAAPDARFAHRGATLGIITGWGGTQRLPRLIGRARSEEIFLTGITVTAEEAMRVGLVRRVVPPEELVSAAKRMVHAAAKPAA